MKYNEQEQLTIRTAAAQDLAKACSDYLDECCSIKSKLSGKWERPADIPVEAMAFIACEQTAHEFVILFDTFMSEYGAFDTSKMFIVRMFTSLTEHVNQLVQVQEKLMQSTVLTKLDDTSLILSVAYAYTLHGATVLRAKQLLEAMRMDNEGGDND